MKKIHELLNKTFISKIKINKFIMSIIILSTLIFSLLTTIILYSLKTTSYTKKSIWASASISYGSNVFTIISFIFIFLFVFNIVITITSVIKLFWKKNWSKRVVEFNIFYNVLIVLIIYILNFILGLYSSNLTLILIFSLLFNLIGLIFIKFYDQNKNEDEFIFTFKLAKFVSITLDTISMLFIITIIYIPFFIKDKVPMVVNEILSTNGNPMYLMITSVAIFALFFISVIKYILNIAYHLSHDSGYVKKTRSLNMYNLFLSTAFFITGYVYVVVKNIQGYKTSTTAYIPLILIAIIFLVSSFVSNYIKDNDIRVVTEKNEKFKLKLFPLIFVLLFTAVTFTSIFLTFIEVEITILETQTETFSLSGLQLLQEYETMNNVYQIFAFVYFVLLFISTIFCILSIVSYLSKSKDYYTYIRSSVYANIIISCIFSLVAAFFIFNQEMMGQYITMLLEHLNVSIPTLYTYTVNSQSIYLCLGSFVILIVMLITRQLNTPVFTEVIPLIKKVDEPKKDEKETKDEPNLENLKIAASLDTSGDLVKIDPCPTFTELDLKKNEFDEILKYKEQFIFDNPNLVDITDFIVRYARDSRLHLTYTHDEIATFIAGLGASRLTILQGMSGTGKTSLPKIFSEAIMGNCELVEVESSWRDKNELLGYYNEFSKRFTPKKFTQNLYKASLNPSIPTFIVLDEMNLSRIEYYFSDFLSLMESEEDKREIKLLNIKIAPPSVDDTLTYMSIKEGHTLIIPKNVWFIGTANRDESTFEISDKVYDRAQTMNFNKRAPKVRTFNEEIPAKYISYEILAQLFVNAKKSMEYNAENDYIVQEVEKILMPYNISFGNRILNQIEEFVKIYCACFTGSYNNRETLSDAVENILYSKVVRKLETKQIDDKEDLAISFDKLHLYKCSEFIRKLDEE